MFLNKKQIQAKTKELRPREIKILIEKKVEKVKFNFFLYLRMRLKS